MKWKNLKDHKPEFNKLVHVAYIPLGIGAPEREGWKTTGRLRESGLWSVKYFEGCTHDRPTATHFAEIV